MTLKALESCAAGTMWIDYEPTPMTREWLEENNFISKQKCVAPHGMPEEVKKEETKKKGILGKMKEAASDKEEQLDILSTFVRLGILVWSGGILTLAYIKLPPALGIPEQKLDPTFIASVFTGTLATFGVQPAKKKDEETKKPEDKKEKVE